MYSPAWVNWRVSDDGMLGWAPVAPAWTWYGGSAYGFGFQSPEPWSFTTFGDVFGIGLVNRVTSGNAALGILGHSRAYVRAQPTPPGNPPSRPSCTALRPPRSASTSRASPTSR